MKMSVKMVDISRTICAPFFASMLFLSSCGGDNTAEGNLADDDCTPTINLSTQLQTQVDINGNISMVPVANNTVSGCGSSSATDALRTYLVTTRFETTEDFDVWNCVRTDGSSLQYALLAIEDFTHLDLMEYGFEIDPNAEDPVASQKIFTWRAPLSITEDTLTFTTRQKVGQYGEDRTESEWTGITLATTDDMSLTSSTEGAMQCNRTVSAVNLAASRFYIPCEFRGPMSAC